ncbi:hypothetical protein IHE44_0000714 [Lamprotornis superbus]|uniref:Uncharacterized protein n=1 Tax=Lamprotornis superbus TaxID=245042 RepID=A0A835P0U1_9PASS|nr:hypothetical protein IHE44_0000714 [Lamprotornis superbus]
MAALQSEGDRSSPEDKIRIQASITSMNDGDNNVIAVHIEYDAIKFPVKASNSPYARWCRSSNMGGKLSKKKKGYSVNDEKAKDKDKKAEGAATEEEETPKEAEDAQKTTETTEVKENNKEEKGEKDTQVTANKTEEKEGEKEKTVTQEETQKTEPEKSEAVVDAKVEPQKNTEQAPKQEEPTAASAPAASSEAPKPSEPSTDAKASQPSEATAPSKADDKSKEEGEAKKTEPPATPAAQETKSEVAPASDSKPSSNEAAPSSKEPAATAAPSSTAKASDPAAPPEEAKPSEVPATNSDQTIADYSIADEELLSKGHQTIKNQLRHLKTPEQDQIYIAVTVQESYVTEKQIARFCQILMARPPSIQAEIHRQTGMNFVLLYEGSREEAESAVAYGSACKENAKATQEVTTLRSIKDIVFTWSQIYQRYYSVSLTMKSKHMIAARQSFEYKMVYNLTHMFPTELTLHQLFIVTVESILVVI